MTKPLVCLITCCALAAAQKNYKDPAEYGLFSASAKDLAANSFDKAISDLDAWKQKYPDSEFKDDRQVFYVLAYAGAKQPEKALDSAGLVANPASLDAAKRVRLLYTAAAAIQQIPNPTPEQIATGRQGRARSGRLQQSPRGHVARSMGIYSRAALRHRPSSHALRRISPRNPISPNERLRRRRRCPSQGARRISRQRASRRISRRS